MYIIKKEGECIALCEAPRYIKVNPRNGCFVQTQETDAQGVAVFGEPYNLPDHTEIMKDVFIPTEGGEEGEGTIERQVAPQVEIEQVDNYAFLQGIQTKNATQDDDITNTQLALCDVYEMIGG